MADDPGVRERPNDPESEDREAEVEWCDARRGDEAHQAPGERQADDDGARGVAEVLVRHRTKLGATRRERACFPLAVPGRPRRQSESTMLAVVWITGLGEASASASDWAAGVGLGGRHGRSELSVRRGAASTSGRFPNVRLPAYGLSSTGDHTEGQPETPWHSVSAHDHACRPARLGLAGRPRRCQGLVKAPVNKLC